VRAKQATEAQTDCPPVVRTTVTQGSVHTSAATAIGK